jgi:hypothetical protein
VRIGEPVLAAVSVVAGIVGIGAVLVLGFSQPIVVGAAFTLLALSVAGANQLATSKPTVRVRPTADAAPPRW